MVNGIIFGFDKDEAVVITEKGDFISVRKKSDMFLGQELIIYEKDILIKKKKSILKNKYSFVVSSAAIVLICIFIGIYIQNQNLSNLEYTINQKDDNNFSEYIENEDSSDKTTETVNNNSTEKSTSKPDHEKKDESDLMDKFDINMLNQTRENGQEWYSSWHLGSMREYEWNTDKYDNHLLYGGDCKYLIYGENGNKSGQIRILGSTPRIYTRNNNNGIHDETFEKWKNVEVTFYSKTVSYDKSLEYAGISALVRTDHISEDDLCGMRSYAGRMLYNGQMDIEKEIIFDDVYKSTEGVNIWGDKKEMPLNTWIGYKLVVRNIENDTKVRLELYVDMSNGESGGKWNLVTSFVDYDGWSKDLESCCTKHKGKPLLEAGNSVLISADGINEQYYKNFSVREIE